MSLTRVGVWQAGVWAPTVWADGVWAETEQPSITGGGNSNRRRLLRRRIRRNSDEETVSVPEIINAVAAEQVARPTTELDRRAQLASALLSYKSISVQEKHLVALEAERERLIGVAVKRYLDELQEREDSVLMLALAEAL